jgi:hypothetical protein
MKEMDKAHVLTWLHCLTASPDLENAMGTEEIGQLSAWLDLLPSYWGGGMNSLSRSADEEFLGSFTTIAASLFAFFRKTELPIYIRIAQALESLGDTGDPKDESEEYPFDILAALRATSDRTSSDISHSTEEEPPLAKQIIRGYSVVEVPGK